MNNETAIQKACKVVGGGSALARALGVTPQTVNEWTSGAAKVPLQQVPWIERATNRQVRCEEIRPDFAEYFEYLRGVSMPGKKPKQAA